MLHEFVNSTRIAYFSMEIALTNDIPTYAGGLGVLAGDTLQSAADLDLPMVGVTLVSRAGYFQQKIDELGRQIELPDVWEPSAHTELGCAKVSVQIEGRSVWVGAWIYRIIGQGGAQVPVILLDTDLPENIPEDREITHFLYGKDAEYRLKQEVVLGLGGVRMLNALGFNVRKYHLNEGHSAFLALELLNHHVYQKRDLHPGESFYNTPHVRSQCIFTTHTPVEAGQDQFDYEMVERITHGDFMNTKELRKLAGDGRLNMTRLALNLSEYVNGVAKSHAEVSKKMFPDYEVHAITNGVHPSRWTTSFFAEIYDNFFPGWRHEPALLSRIDQVPDLLISSAHMKAKQVLFDRIKAYSGKALDINIPTLGFARRMTAYKRPDIIFADLERLRALYRKSPFQIVFAGKAHPNDNVGKQLIEQIHLHIRELAEDIPVVYLPAYDMQLAFEVVSGVDVWLNAPLRPLEASGTSGMKAAFNGVPSLSVLDGWWLEGHIEGITGWAIGDSQDAVNGGDAVSLYEKLEKVVLPLYQDNQTGWISVMKGAIGRNASIFNTHRMIRRYVSDAYIR